MSNRVFPAAVRGLTFNMLKTMGFDTIVQSSPNKVELRIAQTRNPIWSFAWIYDYLKNDPNDIVVPLTRTDLLELQGFYADSQGQFDDFLIVDQDDFAVTNGTLQLVTDTSGGITSAAIATGGTGFTVGDLLAVIGGGGQSGVLEVATTLSGVIASVSVASAGTGYSTTSGVALIPVTGSGSGSPTANITVAPISYSPIQRSIGGQYYEDITDLNPLNGSGLTVKANGVAKSIGTCGIQDAELHGPGLAIPGYSFMGMYLKWCATPTPPITASFNYYFRVRFASDEQDFEKFMQLLWTIGGGQAKSGSGSLKLITSRPDISI